ncbi:hypothetical protein V8D89_012197 [Ganoderma adspersum]
MVHPPGCRQYNSFYDEWDLWFPQSWGSAEDDSSEEARATDSDANAVLDASLPAGQDSATVTATAIVQNTASEKSLTNVLDNDNDLLNPAPEDRAIQGVEIQQNFHLSSWFGITMADTRTFPGVDYEKWANRLPSIFGEMEADFPKDPATRKCIAGWAAAMLERDWRSRALTFTWDLDARNPSYLLRTDRGLDPRLSMSLEHRRVPERKVDPDDVSRWVLVRFQRDPDAGTTGEGWSLLTCPTGALLLARRLSEVDTSRAALSLLVAVGVPARTGILRQVHPSPPPSGSASHSEPLLGSHPRQRLRNVWRERRERPTVRDYDAYCQRVVEFSHAPHARAAWLKGGIVWLIMLEVTGRTTSLPTRLALEEELAAGPSGLPEHYVQVTHEVDGAAYFDDALSSEEMDIISGVVKVYIGIGGQTEDASWWPKHSAWVRGGAYSGIWTPFQEQWFQRRLRDIHDSKAGPRNASKWKNSLKMERKAGALADVVDQASWEFTYRNFVQHPESDHVQS